METIEIIALCLAGIVFLFFLLRPIWPKVKFKMIWVVLGFAGIVTFSATVRYLTERKILGLPDENEETAKNPPPLDTPIPEETKRPESESKPYRVVLGKPDEPKPKIVEIKSSKIIYDLRARRSYMIGPLDSIFDPGFGEGVRRDGARLIVFFMDEQVNFRAMCPLGESIYSKSETKFFNLGPCWPEPDEKRLLNGDIGSCPSLDCRGIKNVWFYNPSPNKAINLIVHLYATKEVKFTKKVEVNP